MCTYTKRLHELYFKRHFECITLITNTDLALQLEISLSVMLYALNAVYTAFGPHSIIVASCKPFLKPGFRQVRSGLRYCDQLSTFLSKICLFAAGSLVRATGSYACQTNRM